MHCSVRAGVVVADYPLVSSIEPSSPFGATATFLDNKVVALTYFVAAPSVWAVTSMLTGAWGSAEDFSRAADDSAMSGRWARRDVTASVSRILGGPSQTPTILVRVFGERAADTTVGSAETVDDAAGCPAIPTRAMRDLTSDKARLHISWTDNSSKKIRAIEFQVWFLDGVGKIVPQGPVLSYVADANMPLFGSRQFISAPLERGRANDPRIRGVWVGLSKIMFDDGASWESGDGEACWRSFMETLPTATGHVAIEPVPTSGELMPPSDTRPHPAPIATWEPTTRLEIQTAKTRIIDGAFLFHASLLAGSTALDGWTTSRFLNYSRHHWEGPSADPHRCHEINLALGFTPRDSEIALYDLRWTATELAVTYFWKRFARRIPHSWIRESWRLPLSYHAGVHLYWAAHNLANCSG
jgi:hypothetical protein